MVAEDRHQERVAQPRIGRIPFHVEIGGIAARWAVFENIPPPGVLASNGHVIRNDIENLTEAGMRQRGAELSMPGCAADLVAYSRVIDYIIPVLAPFYRLQIGRAVDSGNAELRKVRSNRRCVEKREISI